MSVKSTLKASTGLIFSVVLWGTLLAVAATHYAWLIVREKE